MLETLQIENIAVIEQAKIEFGPGLNILTGETGAGKSILIDSIHAVLGERTSKELVRSGCRAGKVTAVFTNTTKELECVLTEMGISPEETLVVQRTLSADGKSTARINGQPATASMLRQIAEYLVNIHGQHDNQGLLRPETHMGYLDCQLPNGIWSAYDSEYQILRNIANEYKALSVDETEKARRAELLRFQIEELEQAEIQEGERDALQARRKTLMNSERILSGIQEAYQYLRGSDDAPGAVTLSQMAADCVKDGGNFLPALESHSNRLADLSYELDDLAAELDGLLQEVAFDPKELEQIEERLDLLYRFSKKYGQTETEMLQYLENARRELNSIETSSQRLEELAAAFESTREKVLKCGQVLTDARRTIAHRFSQQVQKELTFLNMPKVRFVVDFQEKKPGRTGADVVEFLISVNPGEPPRPISKIASGGELSRIMLAIKSVLAFADPVGTLIFDEIDTGISGSAARKVGIKLKQTAANAQVICVTHLAQIASLADTHLLIEKKVKNERTYTNVEPLDRTGRIYELARIMGAAVTETALQSAAELLDQTDASFGG